MLRIEIKEGTKGIMLGELDEIRWRREIQQKVVELMEDTEVNEILITRTGIPDQEPEEEDKGIVCLTCRKKPEECQCPDKETPDESTKK